MMNQLLSKTNVMEEHFSFYKNGFYRTIKRLKKNLCDEIKLLKKAGAELRHIKYPQIILLTFCFTMNVSTPLAVFIMALLC